MVPFQQLIAQMLRAGLPLVAFVVASGDNSCAGQASPTALQPVFP